MPVSQVEELYPSFPDDHPVIAPTNLQAISIARHPPPGGGDGRPPVIGAPGLVAQPRPSLIGTRGPDVGSNNWAISGDLSSTGEPLLANDPHLGIAMPSIWYEVGLHCTGGVVLVPLRCGRILLPGKSRSHHRPQR